MPDRERAVLALDEDALRSELIARFALKLPKGENVAQIVDWAFDAVRDEQRRAALRGQPETPGGTE